MLRHHSCSKFEYWDSAAKSIWFWRTSQQLQCVLQVPAQQCAQAQHQQPLAASQTLHYSHSLHDWQQVEQLPHHRAHVQGVTQQLQEHAQGVPSPRQQLPLTLADAPQQQAGPHADMALPKPLKKHKGRPAWPPAPLYLKNMYPWTHRGARAMLAYEAPTGQYPLCHCIVQHCATFGRSLPLMLPYSSWPDHGCQQTAVSSPL